MPAALAVLPLEEDVVSSALMSTAEVETLRARVRHVGHVAWGASGPDCVLLENKTWQNIHHTRRVPWEVCEPCTRQVW